jgi:hypothetical protein
MTEDEFIYSFLKSTNETDYGYLHIYDYARKVKFSEDIVVVRKISRRLESKSYAKRTGNTGNFELDSEGFKILRFDSFKDYLDSFDSPTKPMQKESAFSKIRLVFEIIGVVALVYFGFTGNNAKSNLYESENRASVIQASLDSSQVENIRLIDRNKSLNYKLQELNTTLLQLHEIDSSIIDTNNLVLP